MLIACRPWFGRLSGPGRFRALVVFASEVPPLRQCKEASGVVLAAIGLMHSGLPEWAATMANQHRCRGRWGHRPRRAFPAGAAGMGS